MTTYFDADLVRHLHSSLSLYLKPTVEGLTKVKFFVEGVDEEIASAFQQDSAVLKINGPWLEPLQGGENYHRVEVLVLMTALTGTKANRYKLFEDVGKVANELSKPIPVYRHGDDDTRIGCLDMDRRSRDFVRVVNYGLIDKDASYRQMAVIARYELTF